MVCKNCGNQVADDALFCTSCGIKLENEELAVGTDFVSMVNSAKIWKKNARTALILGIVSISIIPAIILTWICVPAFNVVISFILGLLPVVGVYLAGIYSTVTAIIAAPIMVLLFVCSAIGAPVCAFIARSLIKKAKNLPEVTPEVMDYTDDEDLYKDYLSAQKKAGTVKILTTIVVILFWIALALLVVLAILAAIIAVLAILGGTAAITAFLGAFGLADGIGQNISGWGGDFGYGLGESFFDFIESLF